MRNYICKTCDKKFIGKIKNHIYQFCSIECQHKSMIGQKCPNRKEKIDRSGYWYIYKPEHPFSGKQGYIAEHRLIMEKFLGRYLTKIEVIHHKNHIITDNRIENLELFSSHGQHAIKAHPEIYQRQKGITIKQKRCKVCNKIFDYTWKTARRITCSNKCWHTY